MVALLQERDELPIELCGGDQAAEEEVVSFMPRVPCFFRLTVRSTKVVATSPGKANPSPAVCPIKDFRAICRAVTFDAKLVENGNINEEHQDLQLCDVETFDSVMTSFQHGLGFCFTWQSADGSIACKGGVPMRVEPYSWDETRDTASKRAHPKDSLKILVGSFAQAGWPRLSLGWKPAAVSGSELVLGLGDSNVLSTWRRLAPSRYGRPS